MKGKKLKWIIVMAILGGGMGFGIKTYIEYQQFLTVDINRIDQETYLMRSLKDETKGHGFPYENGWSSVDLHPYYVQNEFNKLVKLEETSDFTISDANQMPVLDGAEAAYPVYSAFALQCYEDIAKIQEEADSKEEGVVIKPIQFTNTVEGFKRLVSGEVDIFFGARPSETQRRMAEEAGKELVLTPIGKEAFVFFVSQKNPVKSLSVEQIRQIYSGKVNNWKEVGGKNIPILAFQRPKNSGSQTMMEYFMGDVPLKEPVEVEFEYSMVGIIRGVADYQNKKSSIGYSFRYYATQMTGEESNIKFLEIDGIAPSKENIIDESYPFTTQLYAITLADNPNENTAAFVNWMTGEQGKEIVRKTGYVI